MIWLIYLMLSSQFEVIYETDKEAYIIKRAHEPLGTLPMGLSFENAEDDSPIVTGVPRFFCIKEHTPDPPQTGRRIAKLYQ